MNVFFCLSFFVVVYLFCSGSLNLLAYEYELGYYTNDTTRGLDYFVYLEYR